MGLLSGVWQKLFPSVNLEDVSPEHRAVIEIIQQNEHVEEKQYAIIQRFLKSIDEELENIARMAGKIDIDKRVIRVRLNRIDIAETGLMDYLDRMKKKGYIGERYYQELKRRVEGQIARNVKLLERLQH